MREVNVVNNEGSGAPLPTVSVVIPAYNAAAFLDVAIDSVARQTYRNLEIIVIDDASDDRTAERAQELLASHGLRHTVKRLSVNGGPSFARNRGVELARGEYVAFLDADDEWLPEKLAKQVALMDANPRVTLCGCQADWVDVNGGLIRPLYKDLPPLLPEGWKLLLWNCYVATPCAMVRRLDLGIYPFDVNLRVGEDRDLWIRLASNGTVGLVNEKLVVIRTSSGSFMARHAQLVQEHTKPMIEGHLASLADGLTMRDRMRALGLLHSQIGKCLIHAPGQYVAGLGHLCLAVLAGFRPADGIRSLLFALPVIRDVKTVAKAWLGA